MLGWEIKGRDGHRMGLESWQKTGLHMTRRELSLLHTRAKAPQAGHNQIKNAQSLPSSPHLFLPIPPQVANPTFVLFSASPPLSQQPNLSTRPQTPAASSLPLGHYHLLHRLLTTVDQTVSSWQPRLILLNAYFEIISNSEKSLK